MPTVDAIREALAEPEPIEFFAEGIPKGQPRPRAFARKMGGKFVARVYDDASAEGWKSCIAAAPIVGPVRLRLWFAMPRPQGHRRVSGEVKETAPLYHTSKPDCDNLQKAVMDAMTTLGFWWDDSQVCSVETHKVYANDRPGVSVKVEVAR